MLKKETIIAVIFVCLPFLSPAQPTAIACWTDKGEPMQLTMEEPVLKIPPIVAAIDLCGVKTVALDCSSANPNCLFYIDGATAVEGLPDANVVCDGVCEGLLLTDDACFYCPMAFTVDDAMLRFTPRRDDGGETDFAQPCHETVFLPFDADFVIPADVNGPMPGGWLQLACYDGYDSKSLFFRETDAEHLTANTPYLARFAYAAYGTKILFCGQDKTVEATKMAIVGNPPFVFTGITKSENEESGFFRYHRGQEQYFIHTGKGMPMEPFRCFIMEEGAVDIPLITDSEQILEYILEESESTRIDTYIIQHPSEKYYDMLGRQMVKGKRGRGISMTRGFKVIH